MDALDAATVSATATPVTLCLDARERALLAELRGLAPQPPLGLEEAVLDVGDVHVRVAGHTRLVIERKTVADLKASLCDGRYAEQRARMHSVAAAAGWQVAYVLEGDSFSWSAGGGEGEARGVSAAALQGAVLSWMWPHGAHVLFTRDPADTACLLERLARRLFKSSTAAQPSQASYSTAACAAACARKRANMGPRLCLLQQLCQVPGVSPRLAGAIVDHLLAGPVEGEGGGSGSGSNSNTSMRALLTAIEAVGAARPAQQRRLQQVPGVGAKTAATMLSYLLGPP